jgi:hypothetical protein
MLEGWNIGKMGQKQPYLQYSVPNIPVFQDSIVPLVENACKGNNSFNLN